MRTTGRSTPARWLVLTSNGDSRRIADTFLARSPGVVAPTVESVADTREALSKIGSENFDLLLLGPDIAHAALEFLAPKLKQCCNQVPMIVVPEIAEHDTVLAEPNQDGSPVTSACVSGDGLSPIVPDPAVDAAEEQLNKTSEGTVRTLYGAIEQAADLVVITDTCGTIEYVNPAFENAYRLFASRGRGANSADFEVGRTDHGVLP